jgi:thiamine biosynthesis lipoprotein
MAGAQLFRQAFRAMGSPCEIQLFARDPTRARAAFAAMRADIERLEGRYSRYRDTSLVSAINRAAAQGGRIEVDAETACLLDYADACFRESEGLFDVTSGILRRAWKLDRGELPDERAVAALLDRVGWQRIRWERPALAFPIRGMEIDLGGVVKEYAADRAAAVCRAQGVQRGMVNLGGDIRIVGPRPGGAPWRIGIRHPRRKDRVLTTLLLSEGAVASSGDYERCIEIDGVRYGHILDPRTGWPVRHLAAVSVVAGLGVVAGSVSTIAMLFEAAGPGWLARSGLPHVWIDVDGRAGGPLLA